MSLSERLQTINEQIAALTKERNAILKVLHPPEDAIREFVRTLLLGMESVFGCVHPDTSFAERLIAGLTSEPTTTNQLREGKYYDPAWHITTISYEWGSTSIEVEKSTNLNHPTEYRVLCGDDESYDSENPLAIDSWGDLNAIDDKLKVAAMMMHLEY
jgi:hypothetical protein